MSLAKTNIDGFYKDQHTNVIVNTNKEEYTSYKNQIKKAKKIAELEEKVNLYQDEISEIKFMLMKLLEKNNV
jgi:hypothetical protein